MARIRPISNADAMEKLLVCGEFRAGALQSQKKWPLRLVCALPRINDALHAIGTKPRFRHSGREN
jgi:hypothetical protein